MGYVWRWAEAQRDDYLLVALQDAEATSGIYRAALDEMLTERWDGGKCRQIAQDAVAKVDGIQDVQ